MDPFMDGYKSVLPYLINDSGEPEKERRQSPEDRHRYDTTKCILCACCTTSCPVFWGDEHVRGARGDRERPPVHLRLARRGRP